MSRDARATLLACMWGAVVGAAAPWPAIAIAERLTPLLAAKRAFVVLPLLLAAPFFPVWILRVRRGAFRGAALAALTWALATSVAEIVIFRRTGDEYTGLVWNSIQYRHDMLGWIENGIGAESDPSQFIPQHALHFAAFAAASLVSVGFLGLVLGAALLSYMNVYVAALFVHATRPWTIATFGWPAYAMIRVAGYVCVGSALAAVTMNLVGRAGVPWKGIARAFCIGLVLVLLDVLIKTWTAPWYREVLGNAISR